MTNQMQMQIQKLVDSFASEFIELYRQAVAEAVDEALGLAPMLERRRTRRTAPRSTKKARTMRARPHRAESGFYRRSPEELEELQSRLLREVKKKGGRRIEEIADSMGEDTRTLTLPMKKLISDRKIKTAGQKRATRYSAA